eukprot:2583303-Pleurochrysis_carterae.AAC.1
MSDEAQKTSDVLVQHVWPLFTRLFAFLQGVTQHRGTGPCAACSNMSWKVFDSELQDLVRKENQAFVRPFQHKQCRARVERSCWPFPLRAHIAVRTFACSRACRHYTCTVDAVGIGAWALLTDWRLLLPPFPCTRSLFLP